MLEILKIKNFALIEYEEIHFGKKLSVFTGETGSGKSLVLDALKSILGCRSSLINIRDGEDFYSIEAQFDIQSSKIIQNWILNKGLVNENPSKLCIQKEFHRNGKSKILLNNHPIQFQLHKEIGSLLCEIQHQNEQVFLTNKEVQIDILDEYSSLIDVKSNFKKIFIDFKNKKLSLENLKKEESNNNLNKELTIQKLAEIEEFQFSEIEENKLIEEELFLKNSEKILENYSSIANILINGDSSVLNQLRKMLEYSSNLSKLDLDFKLKHQNLEEIISNLRELNFYAQEKLDSIQYSQERMNMIQDRLDKIAKFKKKYGESETKIHEYNNSLKNQLGNSESLGLKIIELSNELKSVQKQMADGAIQLSKQRRESALKFENEMNQELKNLGMEHAKIKVMITWDKPHEKLKGDVSNEIEQNIVFDNIIENSGSKYLVSENGLDRVEFYFTNNFGEKLKQVSKIASGGELSRILLSIKILLSSKIPSKIYLFDEIDSGVSAESLTKIALKLKILAESNQVLIVTHSQQISAIAKTHFKVEKQIFEGRTQSKIKQISGQERVLELASLISGNNTSIYALKHAEELLTKKAI